MNSLFVPSPSAHCSAVASIEISDRITAVAHGINEAIITRSTCDKLLAQTT